MIKHVPCGTIGKQQQPLWDFRAEGPLPREGGLHLSLLMCLGWVASGQPERWVGRGLPPELPSQVAPAATELLQRGQELHHSVSSPLLQVFSGAGQVMLLGLVVSLSHSPGSKSLPPSRGGTTGCGCLGLPGSGVAPRLSRAGSSRNPGPTPPAAHRSSPSLPAMGAWMI